MSQEQAAAMLARDVTRQGMFLGANEIFWLCAILFVVITGLIWFSRPPKAATGAAPVVDAGH